MGTLGLTGPKPKASRYAWFLGRFRALDALGIVAETRGSASARMVAEIVLEHVDAGIIQSTRDGAYKVREVAARFRDIGTIYGEGRA